MKGNEVENLLRDMQEYRELTNRVKAIYGDQMTLKDMVDVMERIIREPGRKDPVNARILTYDEAAMWDEYRKIGTPEECRAAVGKTESIVDKLEESVKLARQRCIDCPVNSPAYARYQMQYHERAMFLEIVKDIVEREM